MSETAATFLFDLGNTRLKFAAQRDDGTTGAVVAIAHDGARFPDGWDAALPARFDAAAVAMVGASSLREALLDALTARCGRISIARTAPQWAGLRIAYAQPAHLGVDRFLAMLGARAHRPAMPLLVVGIGTAITLDLIDAEGRHHGGRIAASPALMREALHARARQLPADGGVCVDFADDTLDALRSGCDGAALALIDHGLRDGERRLGAAPTLVLHGGGVDALDTHWPADALRAPSLVLEGLGVWARMPG